MQRRIAQRSGISRFDGKICGPCVLILGDIDPRLLSPSSLELIDDFVRNQGGGLIVIAGELNNPFQWNGSILEKLLPFRVSDAQLPERADTPFQPLLTLEATVARDYFDSRSLPQRISRSGMS